MYSATTLSLFILLVLMTGIPSGVEAKCDTDANCQYKVFGIGIYYINLHSIRIDSSTFFLSYQLTIFEHKKLFNSRGEAEGELIGSDFACKNESSEGPGDQWKPLTTDKEQLLFPNQHPSADIDTSDNSSGRYFISGTHFFEPVYSGYPYHSNSLINSLELRNQTSVYVTEGLRDVSILFCYLKSYSAFDENEALNRFSEESGSEPVTGVTVNVQTICWQRLGTDLTSIDNCSDHEKSKRLTASIPFRFDKHKRNYIAISRSVVVTILALLAYFLPPSMIGDRSRFLFGAIFNMVVTQSTSFSQLFKSPTWTSVNYLNTTTIIFLAIAIIHYVFMMWMQKKFKEFLAIPCIQKFNSYWTEWKSENLNKNKKDERKRQQYGSTNNDSQCKILWQGNLALAAFMIFVTMALFLSVFYGAVDKYTEPTTDDMERREKAFFWIVLIIFVISAILAPLVFLCWISVVYSSEQAQSVEAQETSSQPAPAQATGGGGRRAVNHLTSPAMSTLLCIFLCSMSITTAQPIKNDPNQCQVIGIGMYFFDLNEVSVAQGKFFASYQLIIKEHETPYPNCTQAREKAVDVDGYCKMETNQDPAWKHWGTYDGVTNGHSKDQLLLLNVQSNAGIDDFDRKNGRYLIKGTHHFTPKYKGYPFVKMELGVKIQVRNQTFPQTAMNVKKRAMVFCNLSPFSGLQKNIQLVENSNSKVKLFFKIDEQICWPPLKNIRDCSSQPKREQSPQFYGYIEYQWYTSKATLSALSPVIIIIILAILSYGLPAKELGQRFGMFLLGVVSLAINQSNNLDSFMSEVPSFTRVAYANIVGIEIILIAAAHGVFFANIQFLGLETEEEKKKINEIDKKLNTIQKELEENPSESKRKEKRELQESKKEIEEQVKEKEEKKLEQYHWNMARPAVIVQICLASSLLLLCSHINSEKINGIYIAVAVILGVLAVFAPTYFMKLTEKKDWCLPMCGFLFINMLMLAVSIGMALGNRI